MKLNSNELEYLWKILMSGLILNREEQTIKLIHSQDEMCFELPAEIQSSLTQYSLMKLQSVLWDLALFSLKNFYFNLEKQVRLVALLFTNAKIDVKYAFHFLEFDGISTDKLDFSIQSVVDVCWLLKEDKTLDFMEIDEDNLLANSLFQVNNIYYAENLLKN